MTYGWSAGSTIADGLLLVALPVAVVAGLVSFFSHCCLPARPRLPRIRHRCGGSRRRRPVGSRS